MKGKELQVGQGTAMAGPGGFSGSYETMINQAKELIRTGFLPAAVDTPQKAVAIAQMGMELGLPMMASFREIYVVKGKPTLSGQSMLAMAWSTNELTEFIADDVSDDRAVVVVKRGDKHAHKEVFSWDDARKMGLIHKENWSKMPKIMLRWRCIANALRLIFPDRLGGIYLPEEIDPDVRVNEVGAVVNYRASEDDIKQATVEAAKAASMPAATMVPGKATVAVEPEAVEEEPEISEAEKKEVRDIVGQIKEILSTTNMDYEQKKKWMVDAAGSFKMNLLTKDIASKALKKAKAQFAAKKAAKPAVVKKKDGKPAALKAVFASGKDASFDGSDAVRDWVKAIFGKGLSKMDEAETKDVLETIKARKMVIDLMEECGLSGLEDLQSYISDTGGEKDFSQMNKSEIVSLSESMKETFM